MMVVASDLLIYRGEGYAGFSALFVLFPFLLCLGSVHKIANLSLGIVGGMLLLLALRLLWCGTPLAVTFGFLLIPAFALTLSGMRPHVPEALRFASRIFLNGLRGLHAYLQGLLDLSRRFTHWNWLAVVLPIVVGLAFSFLFILANPDLLRSFNDYFAQTIQWIQDWFAQYPLGEILFWMLTAWLGIGLLRPFETPTAPIEDELDRTSLTVPTGSTPDPLYAAFRNTLLLVIILFAAYLIFEFQTLWFRVFPEGFHYSGYAHEGAAWLTVALAFATALLSLIFRGRLLADRRLASLQSLAFLWSFENLLLTVAVYNRLLIYVGFNGMTWMRVVGFYGVTTVVAGFLLVLWKIRRRYNFLWLIRRQLLALALAIYLYTITPVDYLVMRHNISRIVAGDNKPAVQFSVQTISPEGLLAIRQRYDADSHSITDPVIRDGIDSLLRIRTQRLARNQNDRDWTAFQFADHILLKNISPTPSIPSDEDDSRWQRFKSHVYQWF